jgi:hypothetical protein
VRRGERTSVKEGNAASIIELEEGVQHVLLAVHLDVQRINHGQPNEVLIELSRFFRVLAAVCAKST